MYVDRLDLSTVDFTGIGGPPPPHKFAVSAWTYDAVKAVLAVDKITDRNTGNYRLVLASFFARHSFIFTLHNI